METRAETVSLEHLAAKTQMLILLESDALVHAPSRQAEKAELPHAEQTAETAATQDIKAQMTAKVSTVRTVSARHQTEVPVEQKNTGLTPLMNVTRSQPSP